MLNEVYFDDMSKNLAKTAMWYYLENVTTIFNIENLYFVYAMTYLCFKCSNFARYGMCTVWLGKTKYTYVCMCEQFKRLQEAVIILLCILCMCACI